MFRKVTGKIQGNVYEAERKENSLKVSYCNDTEKRELSPELSC